MEPRSCPPRSATSGKRAFASKMRRNPTPAELALWQILRRRGCQHHFRRQHVIAGYIVDFYCTALRLAVEVDGPCHVEVNDALRDSHLSLLGVTVLRLRNEDVLSRPDFTIDRIVTTCDTLATVAARREAP